MNAERHQRLRHLFLAARALPREQRAAFAAALGGADRDLAEPLRRLLAADDGASLLDRPALGSTFTLPEPDTLGRLPLPPGMPQRIGAFELLDVIGVGGMGIVYRALQDAPRRQVALKVLQPGRATPAFLRRFAFEVEALGRLQHPNVAAIFDAGTVDHGAGPQPYFAMELLDGEPLLAFAAARALDRTARTALLVTIADAVQHAHQRGIVHRDLKPANVLVDRDGRAKVLDFGIAAAGDGGGDGLRVGTVPYASPEQLAGDKGAIDVRTDVYSLGVLGHEFVFGVLPDRDLPAAGDLAQVLRKACAAAAEQRYGSVAEFAADLRRCLADEPIQGAPVGNWRRLRLFARRRRGVVVGVVSTVLALLIGLVATWRALGEAEAQRALAEDRLAAVRFERDRAESVRGFVLGLLGRIDPQHGDDGAGLDRMLAAAERQVRGDFGRHPDLEADVRLVLGGVMRLFARYEAAEEHLQRALSLRQSTHGPLAVPTLAARLELARTCSDLGRWQAALELLAPWRQHGLALPGVEPELALRGVLTLSQCLLGLGEVAAASTALAPAMAAWDTAHESTDTHLHAAVLLVHATCLLAAGDLFAARTALERGLERCTAQLGADDPVTVDVQVELGLLLVASIDSQRGERLLTAALAHRRARLPNGHPSVLQLVHNLAVAVCDRGDPERAVAMFAEAAQGRSVALGPSHPLTIGSLVSRANALGRAGRFDEAAAGFDDALARMAQAPVETEWLAPTTRAWRAVNLARQGDLVAAAEGLRRAVAELTSLEGEQGERPRRFRRLLEQIERRLVR